FTTSFNNNSNYDYAIDCFWSTECIQGFPKDTVFHYYFGVTEHVWLVFLYCCIIHDRYQRHKYKVNVDIYSCNIIDWSVCFYNNFYSFLYIVKEREVSKRKW